MRRKRDSYDYVIIGGGSAGSVLGARLSEDKDKNVLVLEAGRSDYFWDLFIQMPAALMFPSGNRFYDWEYQTDEEPHMGRRVDHARGKVLGGSSSINGMNINEVTQWTMKDGQNLKEWTHGTLRIVYHTSKS